MRSLIVRLVACVAGLFTLPASGPAPSVPLVPGLVLVSALHTSQGDRENVVIVGDVSADGVSYTWRFTQHAPNGKSSEGQFTRFVRATDQAGAPRLNTIFMSANEETPGYTAMSISRATYNRVRTEREIPFTVTTLTGGTLGPAFDALGAQVSGLVNPRLTLKGSLTLAAPGPQLIPVLLDGRRVSLPAIHVKGRFGPPDERQESDFWILADSANPLILRVVTGQDVFQMVRIELPKESSVEHELERACRAELPGIYFAFASAELESASNAALDGVAALLGKHPDWSFVIEGHTDSIGSASANQRLSAERAEAVRRALVDQRRIAAARLTSAGFGPSRPREPNATIEGRARNRRVELVRNCAR